MYGDKIVHTRLCERQSFRPLVYRSDINAFRFIRHEPTMMLDYVDFRHFEDNRTQLVLFLSRVEERVIVWL